MEYVCYHRHLIRHSCYVKAARAHLVWPVAGAFYDGLRHAAFELDRRPVADALLAVFDVVVGDPCIPQVFDRDPDRASLPCGRGYLRLAGGYGEMGDYRRGVHSRLSL